MRRTGDRQIQGPVVLRRPLETMESNAELTDALANVSNEEAAESAAQFDADLEEL